ncbi:MFS transporter [Gorillibacterium massiliense]|uniref:MFS transporter n=1 Tax=Gorillibacterium massiliense TaxID=1280390 RepID=UPI0004B5A930|nr:MFS transporter [Gorillibacterium massiliense]
MDAANRLLRQNVKNNFKTGIFWALGFNFTTPFFAVVAARFGATNTHYALLNSVPALLTILSTIPASSIIERFRHQKRISAGFLLLSRLCYLLIALLPLLPFDSRITGLILLVGIFNATSSIVSVCWQAMIGEIIPLKYRNKVFAKRNFWNTLTGMAATLLAGFYIDSLPFPIGYQSIYILGFVAAIFETWYFLRLRVPSEESELAIQRKAGEVVRGVSLTTRLKEFIGGYRFQADRSFYLFCLCSVIFNFTWIAAWPIFTKVKVDILHASNFWISIDTVAGALGSLMAFALWARHADWKGNGHTVFLSTLLMSMNPLMWLLAHNMVWVSFIDMAGGLVTAGYTQSSFNRLLELAPKDARQKALAFYTSITQISAIIAPLVGMRVYEMIGYEKMMIVTTGVRLVAAVSFLLILYPAGAGFARKAASRFKRNG